MTILNFRRPGFNAMRRLREAQVGVLPVGVLGRFFGVSPVSAENLLLCEGAGAELMVGALLDSLRFEGYVVLHSVPVGELGGDVDHIVVSPTGKVFLLNSKYHAGVRVVEGSSGVFVNGRRHDFVSECVADVKLMRKLLGALTGNPKIFPVVVFVGVKGLVEREGKKVSDVKLVTDSELLVWVRGVEAGSVSESFDVSSWMVSSFWSEVEDEVVDQDELLDWFYGLGARVVAAKFRRSVLKFVGLLVVFGVNVMIVINVL